MPTLIRLLIVLVLLGGLGFAGLWFLAGIQPEPKTITVTIPARELLAAPEEEAPLSLDNLPAPVNIVPREESSSSPAEPGDSSILDVTPGAPE